MAGKKKNTDKFSEDEGGGEDDELEESEGFEDEDDDAMLDEEDEEEDFDEPLEDDEGGETGDDEILDGDEEIDDDDDNDSMMSGNELATTSRQKDIKRGGKKINLSLLAPLPSNTRKKKELTEEMKQKKSELAIQRRNKKIEEDEAMMRDVVNQLFYRKAATKEVNPKEEKKPSRHDLYKKENEGNTICYKDTIENGKTISYPIGHPMIDIIEKDKNNNKETVTKTTTTKTFIKCSVVGCNNQKRYNCAKNNLPVCTIECYNKIINQ